MAVQTSANYNKIISLPGGKRFHAGAHVDFADGRSIELDDRNIMQGYPSIQDKTSEEGKFEVGGAYSSLLTLKLNNFEGNFKDYNFKGAVIKPWIGLTTAVHWRDGEIVEKIQKGVFTVTEAPEVNSVISITAYDNLVKMDAKYSEKSTLTYPATLGQIAADACSVCGVNLATAAFPNSDYVVAKRPDSNTITCREILKYAAQLAGCVAKCNRDGDAEIRWYEAPEHIFDISKNAKTVSAALSETIITGVQIKGNDDSGTIYKAGTDDYAVRIQDNPLAQDGLQSLVNSLGTRLIGTHFPAYSVDAPMNPAIETGDIVWLTDKSGARYASPVTGAGIDFGDYEQFRGDAESEAENQSERFDKADKAQESADDAQQTADDAQKGVGEAKASIETLNGQITLKADKDKLISLINISPESIKIKSNRIEITGEVVLKSDLEDGDTTIDGACIKTGRIESDDGSWWLDLESGEVYMNNGTFAGIIQWADGSLIKHDGADTRIYSAGDLTLESGNTGDGTLILNPTGQTAANTLDVDDVEANSINCSGHVNVGSLAVSGHGNGYTGSTVVQGVDGSHVGLEFHSGILTDMY